MSKATLIAEIMQLTPEERRELVDELQAVVSGEDLSPTPEQMAEVRRRLAEHDKHPERSVSWEEVRERLIQRYKA